MRVKTIILGLMSFLFLSFFAIRTSRKWISAFWQHPSQFQSSKLKAWPAGLNLKIPFRSDSSPNTQYMYIKTDELGALSGPESKSPARAWVFGRQRTANFNCPPQNRWTSLLEIRNRNFGFPGLKLDSVEAALSELFNRTAERPDWILLGEFSIHHRHKFFKWPDLDYFWIWNKPAISHPLYEWLCFFLSSPICQWEMNSSKSFTPLNLEKGAPHENELQQGLDNIFSQISQLGAILKPSQIKLLGLIFPVSSGEPKWKVTFNNHLRTRFSQLHIPFVDGENCFKKSSRKSLFSEKGDFSQEGNQEFANCVNAFFSN